jgi:hypothetical protein
MDHIAVLSRLVVNISYNTGLFVYINYYFLHFSIYAEFYYRLDLSVSRVLRPGGYIMKAIPPQLEVEGVPPYVKSWSAATIPGFIPAVLERWQSNQGDLPPRFVMVLCPKVEIDARGGLPSRVRELTNPRRRFLHFTGCHKPYVVLLHAGEDTEVWRAEVQRWLSWSESYQASLAAGIARLRFIDAVEEPDNDCTAQTTHATVV